VDGDLDGDADCADPDCDGKACSDNNACTTGDVCADNACVPGPAQPCDDQSLCTTDTCDIATGCAHAAIACNDTNLCTTDSCVPATGCAYAAISCDDDDACTTDSCDPAIGCVFTAVPNCCEVNDDCAEGEVCWQNECKAPVSGCFPFGIEATAGTAYGWWDAFGKAVAGISGATGPGTMDEAPSGTCSVTLSVVPVDCVCHLADGKQGCCYLPGGGFGCVHNGDCL